VKHEFYTDEDGDRDDSRSEGSHHNGPVCRVCGESFCVHCSPERVDEECAGPNRDVSIGVDEARSSSPEVLDHLPHLGESRLWRSGLMSWDRARRVGGDLGAGELGCGQ
jgi:hypothetical protein